MAHAVHHKFNKNNLHCITKFIHILSRELKRKKVALDRIPAVFQRSLLIKISNSTARIAFRGGSAKGGEFPMRRDSHVRARPRWEFLEDIQWCS